MRLIQIHVPDEQLDTVTETLDDEGIDHIRQRSWFDGEQRWLVEFPVPADAIRHVLDLLAEADIDTEQYLTLTTLEAAKTPRSERLQERFADDFDPLTQLELRTKARDLSHDTRSFLGMIFLSAIIAVAGLLVGSPAVVVGSMVIAPIVGPVLTAAVGAATGDREMLVRSVWIQAAGLGVAIVGAGLFSYGLQLAGFFPASLDLTTINLIALRVAPSFAAVVVGLTAGGAAAYGLVTKGPTSLIGVMIAAALIPAAATVGIATAWAEYRVAVGSLLLLLVTIIVINVGSFAVLWWMAYRPEESGWVLPSQRPVQWVLVVGTIVVLVASVAVVGVASTQQIAFERTVNEAVHETLDGGEFEDTDPVEIQIEYSGVGPFDSPETVTVTVSHTADGDKPDVADALDRRIASATDREVAVRVRFIEYQRPDNENSSALSGR